MALKFKRNKNSKQNGKKAILNKKQLEESLETQNEHENKVLLSNPRKLLLGITEPHLACEFAYHIAKFTNLKVLLIDADGLKPVVSYILGMKDVTNDNVMTDFDSRSSFNMALDYLSKNQPPINDVFKNIAVKHHKNSNLSVLTGNDKIINYENYSGAMFEILLKESVASYDLVIVNLPYNIYDEFYLLTLHHCNYMLYGFDSYADQMINFNSIINFLKKSGVSDSSKHKYVAFNYSPRTKLSRSELKAVLEDIMIGAISGEKYRYILNNEFLKSYANNMTIKNIKEYHKLAQVFGYTTKKKSFFNRNKKGLV